MGLGEAEADRVTKTSWSKRLGHELADARAGEQEAVYHSASDPP